VRGPTLLDAHDLAALFSERAGRPVEGVQRTDEERLAEMLDDGKPPDVAQLLVSLGTATREGFMATHTDVVERLTGRRPRSLAAVLSD
jgi:NAD(P)H dehydrogenase (quinone)